MEEHKTESSEHKHEHHSSKPKKEETYTVTKATLWQVVSAVLGVLFVISLFTGGFGIGDGSSAGVAIAPSPTPSAPSAPSAPAPIVQVSEDDDAVLGDPNAPITIVEFSDYQCPFCSRFKQQTLPQILSDYVEEGKVKIVYRDFPLSFHARAQISAEAAECVRDQTNDAVYYEFHDLLFDNVATWQAGTGADDFVKLAGQLDANIDGEELASCIDSGKFTEEVNADFAAGQAAGVSGTPSFFVNGVKIVGAQPFSAFQNVIESQLS